MTDRSKQLARLSDLRRTSESRFLHHEELCEVFQLAFELERQLADAKALIDDTFDEMNKVPWLLRHRRAALDAPPSDSEEKP